MSINLTEYISELNQNYNDLGEDLLMLEAILLAPEKEMSFPDEFLESSLQRIRDYARQHTKEIDLLTGRLAARPCRQAASAYFPLMAEK